MCKVNHYFHDTGSEFFIKDENFPFQEPIFKNRIILYTSKDTAMFYKFCEIYFMYVK